MGNFWNISCRVWLKPGNHKSYHSNQSMSDNEGWRAGRIFQHSDVMWEIFQRYDFKLHDCFFLILEDEAGGILYFSSLSKKSVCCTQTI